MVQCRSRSTGDDVAKIRYLIAVCNHVEAGESGAHVMRCSRNVVWCCDRFCESYHGMSRICALDEKWAPALGEQSGFKFERFEIAN